MFFYRIHDEDKEKIMKLQWMTIAGLQCLKMNKLLYHVIKDNSLEWDYV